MIDSSTLSWSCFDFKTRLPHLKTLKLASSTSELPSGSVFEDEKGLAVFLRQLPPSLTILDLSGLNLNSPALETFLLLPPTLSHLTLSFTGEIDLNFLQSLPDLTTLVLPNVERAHYNLVGSILTSLSHIEIPKCEFICKQPLSAGDQASAADLLFLSMPHLVHLRCPAYQIAWIEMPFWNKLLNMEWILLPDVSEEWSLALPNSTKKVTLSLWDASENPPSLDWENIVWPKNLNYLALLPNDDMYDELISRMPSTLTYLSCYWDIRNHSDIMNALPNSLVHLRLLTRVVEPTSRTKVLSMMPSSLSIFEWATTWFFNLKKHDPNWDGTQWASLGTAVESGNVDLFKLTLKAFQRDGPTRSSMIRQAITVALNRNQKAILDFFTSQIDLWLPFRREEMSSGLLMTSTALVPQMESLKWLESKGFKFNFSAKSFPPLDRAIEQENLEMLEHLHERGIFEAKFAERNGKALAYAISLDLRKSAQWLFNHGITAPDWLYIVKNALENGFVQSLVLVTDVGIKLPPNIAEFVYQSFADLLINTSTPQILDWFATQGGVVFAQPLFDAYCDAFLWSVSCGTLSPFEIAGPTFQWLHSHGVNIFGAIDQAGRPSTTLRDLAVLYEDPTFLTWLDSVKP